MIIMIFRKLPCLELYNLETRQKMVVISSPQCLTIMQIIRFLPHSTMTSALDILFVQVHEAYSMLVLSSRSLSLSIINGVAVGDSVQSRAGEVTAFLVVSL